jgi:hypothetical protein
MLLREEIFTRYVNQLRRIRTSNTYTLYGETRNYLTDAGMNVRPWFSGKFQVAELPGLVPRDLDEPILEPTPRAQRVTRQLHVQTEIVVAGDDAADLLRMVFADVEAAIGEGRDSVWADITSDTRPRISRSVLEQESNRIAGGIFECFIDYPTFAFKSVI